MIAANLHDVESRLRHIVGGVDGWVSRSDDRHQVTPVSHIPTRIPHLQSQRSVFRKIFQTAQHHRCRPRPPCQNLQMMEVSQIGFSCKNTIKNDLGQKEDFVRMSNSAKWNLLADAWKTCLRNRSEILHQAAAQMIRAFLFCFGRSPAVSSLWRDVFELISRRC